MVLQIFDGHDTIFPTMESGFERKYVYILLECLWQGLTGTIARCMSN